jgi:hypothetical protein
LKAPKKLPRVLTPDEVQAILDGCGTGCCSLCSLPAAYSPGLSRVVRRLRRTLSAGENAVREFRSFPGLHPARRCCIKCNGESLGKPRGSAVEQTRRRSVADRDQRSLLDTRIMLIPLW